MPDWRSRPLAAWILGERALLGAGLVASAVLAAATSVYAVLVGPALRFVFSAGGTGLDPVFAALPLSWRNAALGAVGAGWTLALLILALAFVKGTAYLGQAMAVAALGQRVARSLRIRLFDHLLRLRPQDVIYRSAGDLSARFLSDVDRVERGVTEGMLGAAGDVLVALALLATALALDPWLGSLAIVCLPLAFAFVWKSGRRVRTEGRSQQQALGDVSAQAAEAVRNLPIVKGYDLEPMLGRRFADTVGRIYRSTLKAILWKTLSTPVNEVLGAGALVATLVLCKSRIESGALTAEGFISFFTAVFLMYRPLKSLGLAYGSWQAGLAGWDRIRDVLAVPVEAQEGLAEGLSPFEGLSLDDLGFAYPGREVLQGFGCAIRSGERVALVGASGEGKTTIFNLLMRLLDPDRGEVRVNGRDARIWPPREVRRLFALVTQEPILFDGDIAENILAGNPDAGAAELEAAVRAAGVDRFAYRLPRKLATAVGQQGWALSGGEKQRICLARALVSRAPVLLLDELTASVDAATEADLHASMEPLLQGRTVIFITHRLSTVRRADRILVLAHGRVVEEGSFMDLAQRRGVFRALFEDQMKELEAVSGGTDAT